MRQLFKYVDYTKPRCKSPWNLKNGPLVTVYPTPLGVEVVFVLPCWKHRNLVWYVRRRSDLCMAGGEDKRWVIDKPYIHNWYKQDQEWIAYWRAMAEKGVHGADEELARYGVTR